MIHSNHQENDDDVQVLLSGQYEIDVSQAFINEIQTEHTMTVEWLTENTDKNNNLKYKLSKDLVRCLHQKNNSFRRSNYKDYWIHKSHCNIQLKQQKNHLLFSSMLSRRRLVRLGNGTF